jgi:class 3 adenylate cyclase/tetratricopeptide (TPR) repeat protein
MSDSRRERKIVTVVFCDLVGFTSRAESMDPEDVEALLRPYHARVRAELERHGGTVEKFIGDAVMALFGAPTAHEDDPERAVRAALAIRQFAVEDGLELRVGITTGEALVSLDARPDAGEGMASGDVVNTAARLQSGAPGNGILVDDTTFRATRHVVEFDEPQIIEAKGKSTPLVVRRVLEARARFGVDVAHEARSQLIGRERELAAVHDAFDRARHARTPQLLTLVGVPGIGKSRLVYELAQIVEADPELITWRQGRCLAYGDGVTLWALGEIVKAQAGILEQDPPDQVVEKLRLASEDVLPSGEATWVGSHLLALVGLAEETELGGNRRNEAFSAWRRFFEGLAEQRPVVLVFEDLHWADEALLDFVDEIVDWITDVPLLVVTTARPELLERRPNWSGGKLNASTIALAPLTDDQTAQLLARALHTPLLAAETQAALVERAGGNPLYAEQFAQLYVERGSAEELPLPETLQGIIAARLDRLSAEEKGVVLDAAVVGKVFWAGALGREDDPSVFLSLERKGFVRRQRRPSVDGETELAFAHALVRDVAYGQIPRAERAAKHRRVAEWIESLGRPEDHAEMRAYHWSSALELARASGQEEPSFLERARTALRDAGDRAFTLNSYPAAAAYYGEALELWPPDEAAYPHVVFRRAHALQIADDDRAGEALTQAADILLDAGDAGLAAEAEALLGVYVWTRGKRDDADTHLERAQHLIANQTASTAKARVLAVAARLRALAGDGHRALELAQEAREIAESLGLDELRAHALATIGTAKGSLSESDGMAELEQALEIAVTAGLPIASTVANNLAVARFRAGDLAEAMELFREAYRLAERFGDGLGLRWSRGNMLFGWYFMGEWDEALREADLFIRECESSPHYLESNALEVRANIQLARGEVDAALEDWSRSVARARDAKDPQALVPSLLMHAYGLSLLGRMENARALADEALDVVEDQPRMAGVLGVIAGVFDDPRLRARILQIVEAQLGESTSIWTSAVHAAARGDLERAADLYARMGAVSQAAGIRLHAAHELIESGRTTEATEQLESALEFFRSVRATLLIDRARDLLARSQSASA